MYKIIDIKRNDLLDTFTLLVNDGYLVSKMIGLKPNHMVTLASGYPKDIKDFDLDKYVFKTVKDLKIGDEVITI